MQPANLALVVGGCTVSAFIGGFIGGFVGTFMGSVSGALISLLSCPGVAYAVGLWIGKRKNAPQERELLVGCWLYVLISVVLTGISRRHSIGVIFTLVDGAGVAYLMFRGAMKSTQTFLDKELNSRPTSA